MQTMWARFESDDQTRVRVNDEDLGLPYLSVSTGTGFGVSLEGDAGFARRLADTAAEWADAVEAYEAGGE